MVDKMYRLYHYSQLDIKIAELEEHLRLLESGEYLGPYSADPIHHRRMRLLLHLPETAIQEQSTSEEEEEEYEYLEKKRPLQRDDSGRHSLDSRTTDDTSENISIWNHDEKSQWKPMVINKDLQRSVSDRRTSKFKRDSQKCQTISTEEEDDECEDGRSLGKSDCKCCDDHECEDTGCCADARSSSDEEEGMEATGLLQTNPGFVTGESDDDAARELRPNVVSDNEGDGDRGKEDEPSEVDSLVVEMQDVQMRLLQLNGKSHMIYYV